MERAIDPLLTIDAKLWADEFMATKQRLGDAEFDHAMMLGWFANAIMQGYDEGQRRAKADAQATIAALQARVRELEQWVQDQSTANLETMRHVDEMQSRAMDAESQLTQRTAECDALKLVNDTHMKTVMKLSHVVEQRTAELEAAKQHHEQSENAAQLYYRELTRAKNRICEAAGLPPDSGYEPAIKHLQAELERVRGELVEATHNANVYQSLYSTGCMDRALLENELRDIRTLILALPKVEGEITVSHGYVKDSTRCHALFGADEDAASYAALLRERQKLC